MIFGDSLDGENQAGKRPVGTHKNALPDYQIRIGMIT
jgi:hypothetical protein